ncbi:phage tail assembly chaperone [Serratia marcescens]|uniref:phage tail assembly chaperone n=1 Tax=Serratia marcescens TaxID=615 RepID=UPI000D92BB5A|nr:hypothetical protein [Serratia marcescens]MDS0828887.1 hypothetical protein [Serratia marcescens]PYA06487.1 hypothetical protein DMW43_08885 [Serratia marcescens]
MTEEIQRNIPINGKNYSIVRMNAFDAIHFKLKVATLLTKHGINTSTSLMGAAGKVFELLNEEDHDEILFRLLKASQARCLDGDVNLSDWAALNIVFTPSTIADVYKLAFECIKFSIIPVAEGLKKNIGVDLSLNLQTSIQQLFNGLLTSLTQQSQQS